MTAISEVLRESFGLLIEEPKLFVPKIFSTLTASLFMVLLIDRLTHNPSMTALETVMMFVGLLGISVIGVYSSMMLSSMVKDENRSLRRGFLDVRRKGRNVLSASFGFMLVGAALALVPVTGYLAYLVHGEILILLIAGLLFLTTILGISYVSYFLPITLLERGGLRSAVSDSFQTSEENRKVVTGLLFFSLVLITAAALSTGFLEKLGYIGFVAGRLVSSIVNTYVFTVSPAYYMESRREDFD